MSDGNPKWSFCRSSSVESYRSKSHLSTICVRRAFFSGPQSAVSFTVCLAMSEKLSLWSAVSCKFVCSSFYSAKLYMLGKPILHRITLQVFLVLIVLNDSDFWGNMTDSDGTFFEFWNKTSDHNELAALNALELFSDKPILTALGGETRFKSIQPC